MKNIIGYIILTLILFGIFYAANKLTPKEFTWNPTYSMLDKEPFGAYVFDKLLDKSWDEGYSHTYKGISRLINEGDLTNQNLLIVTRSFNSYERETEELLTYVKEGHQVMIVAENLNPELSDSLGVQIITNFGIWDYLRKDVRKELQPLHFCTPELRQKKFLFPSINIVDYFGKADDIDTIKSNYIIIAENEASRPVMMRFPLGKGNLILAANPKIFTNYGALDTLNNQYLWTALAYLKGAPLVRTEYYHAGQGKSASMFRYILSDRALSWAFYITLFTIFLFIIYTAKRRQKAIPVIKEPENRMLGFVRSIANLYLRKNSNADIVLKKYTYWADALKREYGLDIINTIHDADFFSRFAAKTGKTVDEARALFRELDSIKRDSYLPDSKLMYLIDKMKI